MKLFYKIFLTVFIIVTVFFLVFIKHIINIEKETLLNTLEFKIEDNKKYYASSLSQLLYDLDKEALDTQLRIILSDSAVVKVDFTDFSSTIQLSYNIKKNKNKNLIKSSIPLEMNDIKLGQLDIFYSKDTIDKQIESYVLSILQVSFFLFVFFNISIFYFIRKTTKSINNLIDASSQIAAGNLDVNINVESNDEIGILSEKFMIMRDYLKNKIQVIVQQKKELETIIQEAPNPMIISSEDGNISMINQAWINSSGYSLEETPTIDAWVDRIYDDTEIIISVKKHIYSLYEITEPNKASEFTFFNKNRDLVTWQFSSAPLGVIDGKRTVISSAVDITELKKKDEMLINQSRHAAMGEMIGMIAHQWRQPIAGIAMDANNMLLDIALDDFNTTKAEKYANSITQQTQHLSQTIDDFRNFFKPDKVIAEVNIREILDSTFSIVKDSLKNNNIELTTSFETNRKVKAYPRELMQVFVNIITNSKDVFTSHKREGALINIRVYEDEKYMNTQVCDNGGGIDADILPKVFDPYFSTKDEKTGTGLGLYMSKMIIEEHLNGTIEVYNNDEGACFRVRLLKEQIGKG